MSTQRFKLVAFPAVLSVLILTVACGIAQAAPSAQGTATSVSPVVTTQLPSTSSPSTDIGVMGTGDVFAKPDTAIASVGVDLTGPTLAGVTADASTRMNAVIAKIKSLGVDDKDIQTTSYSVNPITSNAKDNQAPTITGYHVSNMVQVKVRKLDNVGAILDAAITAGANNMGNIYFTIDDQTPFEQQARTKAVADAMAKAKTLADAANVKLGPITSISESVSRPQPLYDRAAPSMALGGAAGPVQSGQLEISISVEMHFAIAQ